MFHSDKNMVEEGTLTFKDHGYGTFLREFDEHISKTHLHII